MEEIVNKFEFTLWSTTSTSQGKSYHYMDPNGINIIFNDWD